MAADEEYTAGPDDLEATLADMDDELADQRATALRASLQDYDLDDEDAALLDGAVVGEDGIEYLPALPVVAIVGRPNVGKSALVNRILGRREAVVEDTPASIAKDAPLPQGKTDAKPTPTPAKAAPAASPAPKQAVTADRVIGLATALRQEAWRVALILAVEGDPDFAAAFDATLRDTWQVDKTFLSRFGKDELKFIASECGLIDHMGAKAFAKLLESSLSKIIDGMLNATGFSWAGRLPSAITLDGKYSPPPAGAGLGVHHAHPEKD